MIKFKVQQTLNPLSQPRYQLVRAARGTMRSSLLLALLMLVLVPAAWGLCLLKIMCTPETPERCYPPVCLQKHMIKAPSLRYVESCPPGRRWAGNRCRSLWRWGESSHSQSSIADILWKYSLLTLFIYCDWQDDCNYFWSSWKINLKIYCVFLISNLRFEKKVKPITDYYEI